MDFKEKINADIVTAMKAKDQAALRALRAIKSAILLLETSEGRAPGPVSDDEGMKLLIKQSKQRKDSIEQYRNAGRHDLIATEEEELAIIERYLPKALTPAELRAEVQKIIAEVGATSAKDMGKVMGSANKLLAGRADGKDISVVVKELLA
ncbi:MAG: hypothetical protein RLZZ165_303 [Bacteroidota bacterium]|jgi:uncharacterized protein YqeY